MNVKTFEVRDSATFIPIVAILCQTQTNERDDYLMRRAGYGNAPCVLITKLSGGRSEYDAYSWGDRTMTCAHHYIEKNFNALETGAVVDVEFILNETRQPKISEQFLPAWVRELLRDCR